MREELFEMGYEKVAHADRARASLGVQLLERSPRVQAFSRNRPVQQVEIHVFEAQPREAGIECAARRVVSLIGVPEFGRDEHFFAFEAARSNCLTDLVFVSVRLRRIHVAISKA
jgi:hypothetical protein